MKIYSSCILMGLFLAHCSVKKEQSITFGNPKFTYSYDTIYRKYKGDFTKNYTGGIDLLFVDSTTYLTYNYCGGNELKLIDSESDSVITLNYYNPDCHKIYSSIKSNGIYVITTNGDIRLYCDKKAESEVIFNVFSNEDFNTLGLEVDDYKAGGDQYVDIPNDVLYFRVKQDYDIKNGKYSKMDYNYPNYAKLNMSDYSIHLFGKQPHYVEYSDYGLLGTEFDLYIGDSIITSEAISGKITVINTSDNTSKVIVCKSKYEVEPIKKWKHHAFEKDLKNKKIEHALLSAEYESLFYNPFTKRYYRIFHPEMGKYNSEGLVNTYLDKKCILMVFDDAFQLIDEVLLPVERSKILKLIPIKDGVEIFMPELYKIEDNRKTFSFLQIHHK